MAAGPAELRPETAVAVVTRPLRSSAAVRNIPSRKERSEPDLSIAGEAAAPANTPRTVTLT